MGDAVTPLVALAAVCLGVGATVGALVWLFGPYGLLGSGLALVAAGLLVPVRERRGEPAEHPAPPA